MLTLEDVKRAHFAGEHGGNTETAKRMLEIIAERGNATPEARKWAGDRSREDFDYRAIRKHARP